MNQNNEELVRIVNVLIEEYEGRTLDELCWRADLIAIKEALSHRPEVAGWYKPAFGSDGEGDFQWRTSAQNEAPGPLWAPFYATPPAAAEVAPDGWKFERIGNWISIIQPDRKGVKLRLNAKAHHGAAATLYRLADSILANKTVAPLPVALSPEHRRAVSEAAELLNALAAWERENGTAAAVDKADEVNICAIVSDWAIYNAARRSGPALTELLAARKADACRHSFHYFGDQEERRCNNCSRLERHIKTDGNAEVKK